MKKEELMARLVPSGECLLWSGAKDDKGDNGYGVMKFNGKKLKAHRVSYELHHGPIPPGMLVMHTCDVRACCNPEHLRLGTNDENMADMKNKGRAARGAGNRNARLTAEQAMAIRREYRPRSREHGGVALARRYGVSPATVSYAVSGRNWAYLNQQ
jgi:hypothetical protein